MSAGEPAVDVRVTNAEQTSSASMKTRVGTPKKERRAQSKLKWRGKTTWLVRGTQETYVPGLPVGLRISDLNPGEIRAALQLRILSRPLLSNEQWGLARAVDSKTAAASAVKLLERIEKQKQHNVPDAESD